MRYSSRPTSLSGLPQCFIETSKKDQSVLNDDFLKNFINVVKKSPALRSSEDLNVITYLLQRMDFLKNLNINFNSNQEEQKKILLLASKKVKYQYFPAGKAVFHEGAFDEKVYLILQGSAVSFTPISQDLLKKTETRAAIETIQTLPDNNELIPSRSSEDLFEEPTSQVKKTKRWLKKLTTLGSLNSADETEFSSKVLPTFGDFEENSRVPTFFNESIDEKEETSNYFDEEYPNDIPKEYKVLLNFQEEFPNKYIKEKRLLYKLTKSLKQGDYFGESVLINNKSRSNTVIALTDLYLISLAKQKYNNLLIEIKGSINQTTQFLQGLLTGASSKVILKLASLFEECYFSFNNVIFNEGDTLDEFYLVREGEIQLCLYVDEVKTRTKGNDKNSFKLKKKQMIATVAKNEALAEEHFFFGSKIKYTAIVASSRAVLLKMRRNIYENLSSSYKNLFTYLVNTSELKQKIRSQQINEIVNAAEAENVATEQKVKNHQNMQKKSQDKLINTGSNLLKSEGDIKSFRRGYLIQDIQSKIEEFSSRKSYKNIDVNQGENFDNFFNELTRSSRIKDILFIQKRKRENSGSKPGRRIKKAAQEDDNKHKTYLDQLEHAVNSLSARNTVTPYATLNEVKSCDPTSSVPTLNLVPSIHQFNDKIGVSTPRLSDTKNLTTERKDIPSRGKFISPCSYRISPGFMLGSSPEKKNAASLTAIKYFGPTQKEVNAIKQVVGGKNPAFSLVEKLQEISLNNTKQEASTVDYFGQNAGERSSYQSKRGTFVNNSNSPRKTFNMHLEDCANNIEQLRSAAKSQDNTRSHTDAKKVLICSKHNMFRLKPNKRVLHEKYVTPRTSETNPK